MMERMKELAQRPELRGAGGGLSKLAMDAEYALAMTDMNEAWGLENFTAWSGPITDERAAQAHALHSSSAQHCLNAVAVAHGRLRSTEGCGEERTQNAHWKFAQRSMLPSRASLIWRRCKRRSLRGSPSRDICRILPLGGA